MYCLLYNVLFTVQCTVCYYIIWGLSSNCTENYAKTYGCWCSFSVIFNKFAEEIVMKNNKPTLEIRIVNLYEHSDLATLDEKEFLESRIVVKPKNRFDINGKRIQQK